MPSMPSTPLVSARPSFSRSTTGVMPAAASASAAGSASPPTCPVLTCPVLTCPVLLTRTVPSPIAASAQCASGARSPEQPSEPNS